MSLETFGLIKDLVATNPPGGDPKSQGDDHIRGIKATLQAQFPGLSTATAVARTAEELNKVNQMPTMSQLATHTVANVTGSRALNTNYTNTSGADMFVEGWLSCPALAGFDVRKNGTVVQQVANVYPSDTTSLNFFTIVPAGQTYSVHASSATIGAWIETTLTSHP